MWIYAKVLELKTILRGCLSEVPERYVREVGSHVKQLHPVFWTQIATAGMLNL
jgi:hypothetical protein